MLSVNEALAAAARYLAETTEDDESIRIDAERAFAVDGTLIVPWNSKAALDDGDIEAELSGVDIGVDLSTGHCRDLDLMENIEFWRRRNER